MRFLVKRQLRTGGKTLQPGDVVDLDGKHVRALIDQRYIEPCSEPAPKGKGK